MNTEIPPAIEARIIPATDRKSTLLNSSHRCISYAVFCLKKKKPLSSPPLESLPDRESTKEVTLRKNIRTHNPLLRPTRIFFNDPATTEIYALSLHDALPI